MKFNENNMVLTKEQEVDWGSIPFVTGDADDTQEKKKRILFVCTGNTCRSPMAAAVYNAQFAGDDSHAYSCGLSADGSGISHNAALVLEERGIVSGTKNAFREHISHTIKENDIQMADLVVGITSRHAMSLLFAFPEAASKITALPMDISDPYGGDEDVYRICLSQIQEALEMMFVKNTESNEESFKNDKSENV